MRKKIRTVAPPGDIDVSALVNGDSRGTIGAKLPLVVKSNPELCSVRIVFDGGVIGVAAEAGHAFANRCRAYPTSHVHVAGGIDRNRRGARELSCEPRGPESIPVGIILHGFPVIFRATII